MRTGSNHVNSTARVMLTKRVRAEST